MYISYNCKKIPEQCWNHDPELKDNKGWTVAMNLAYNGIIPPK